MRAKAIEVKRTTSTTLSTGMAKDMSSVRKLTRINSYVPCSKRGICVNGTRMIVEYVDKPLYRNILATIQSIELKGFPHHSRHHAFRVACWSTAFYCQTTNKPKDFINYFLMGYLHDIGRYDSSADPELGARSVEKIKALGIELGPEYLEAIANHSNKNTPATFPEACLFDADRIDLVRQRWDKPNLKYFSKRMNKDNFLIFKLQALAFVKNIQFTYIYPLLKSPEVIEFFIYLHKHFDLLQGNTYHGSLTTGLKELIPTSQYHYGAPDFKMGPLVFSAKDINIPLIHIASRSKLRNTDCISGSVYMIEEKPDNIIYALNAIELVYRNAVTVAKEIPVQIPKNARDKDLYYLFAFGPHSASEVDTKNRKQDTEKLDDQ